MGRNLDLTSKEWRDLIFEGKNKAYGAYYLRATSNKRHLKALIIIGSLAVLLGILPFAITFVASILPEPEVIETPVELADLDLNKPEEEQPEEEIPDIPVQELINQTAYMAPVIADVAPPEEEVRQITEELNEDTNVISTQTVTDGRDDIIPEELEELATEIVPEKPVIHTYVSEMPTFAGGDAALKKFLKDNLEYPVADLEMGNKGTVVVQFTVSPSGQLTDFKVARSVSPGLDAEALRVVKKMPNWTPGRQNGQAVYVQFNLPVRFEFQTR